MGKRGPMPRKRLLGSQYLAAEAAADAARKQHDAKHLLATPQGITSGAKRRWQLLAPLLHADHRLRPDTHESLLVYCKLADQEELLSDQLVREGAILTSPHGSYANPLHKVVQGLRSQMLRYQACLGLDPSARARLESAGSLRSDKHGSDGMDDEDRIMFGT